jgi:membrane protein YdbS with pleckstrin-like domain
MKNKLSPSVLVYWIFKDIILVVIIAVILAFISQSGNIHATVNNQPTTINIAQYGSLVTFGIPFILLILLALYQILYYMTFSYTMNEGQIFITSGILFSSTKTTDFRMIQDIQSKRGPILMIFGLCSLQGFTSSPDQIRISGPSFRLGGRGNMYTTYRPDINILLPTATAEQLRSQISTNAETPNVHVV